MFNLEQAIKDWRQRMLHAGVKSPIPLDELETHLREQLQNVARIDEKIFNSAVQQFGAPTALRGEFKKVESQNMKRKIIIAIAAVAFFFGSGIILPALALHKQRNIAALTAGGNFLTTEWSFDEIAPPIIGCAIMCAAVVVAARTLKNRAKISAI